MTTIEGRQNYWKINMYSNIGNMMFTDVRIIEIPTIDEGKYDVWL